MAGSSSRVLWASCAHGVWLNMTSGASFRALWHFWSQFLNNPHNRSPTQFNLNWIYWQLKGDLEGMDFSSRVDILDVNSSLCWPWGRLWAKWEGLLTSTWAKRNKASTPSPVPLWTSGLCLSSSVFGMRNPTPAETPMLLWRSVAWLSATHQADWSVLQSTVSSTAEARLNGPLWLSIHGSGVKERGYVRGSSDWGGKMDWKKLTRNTIQSLKPHLDLLVQLIPPEYELHTVERSCVVLPNICSKRQLNGMHLQKPKPLQIITD